MSATQSGPQGQSTSTPERGDELSSLLVGIPAYNEEVAIGSVVLTAKKITDNILVIDDGSTDATANIARAANASVISHESNRGKGAAIRTILDQSRKGPYDAVVLLDGDGQHVPEDIRSIAKPVLEGECDIAIGSRYIERDSSETPLYRRFGQKVLDYATAGSSGTTVSDSQSGFRALSPAAVEELSISTDGYGVESEMISEATDNGLHIEEVPIDDRYEEIDGQTQNPLRHGLAVLWFLLGLVRDRNPLVFYGGVGILVLLLGAVVAIHSALLYQSDGTIHQWRIVLGGVSLIVGTVSLFCGLILNQLSNMIKES